MKLKKCDVKTGPMKLLEHNETNLVENWLVCYLENLNRLMKLKKGQWSKKWANEVIEF